MRIRLRGKYSDEELAEIYKVPHSHGQFADHIIRVRETVELAKEFVSPLDLTFADLSCGDGTVINKMMMFDPSALRAAYLGDYAPGYEFHGPIEETIYQIPFVDVFVFCETIEHLDDPDSVLRAIRTKTGKLILSTPLDETTDDNPEHYWGWGKEDMERMLLDTKFTPVHYREANHYPHSGYRFQIWGCV